MSKTTEEIETPKTKKRIRNIYSPEDTSTVKQNKKVNLHIMEEDEMKLVGNMTNGDLTSMIKNLLIMNNELLVKKTDIAKIETTLNSLVTQSEEIKEEVQALKENSKRHEDLIDRLDNRARKNNLLFRGIDFDRKSNVVEVVTKFCKEILCCPEEIEINSAYAIETSKNDRKQMSIIAEIPRDKDKRAIMACCKNLRGTHFSVQQDYSPLSREKVAKLARLKKEIKTIAPETKIAVTPNYILVEGNRIYLKENYKLVYGRNNDGLEKIRELINMDLADTWHAIVKPEGRGQQNIIRKAAAQKP